ncbi:3-dehydroquinate synthase [Candidatus Thioglobus sp.]|nr:AroB-related putative sugar phosphate phospholyase (cyclizing) [Candidatus Thioglobus sp.]MDA8872025.1 3-dehydroquinate synthase [Candidatus Thioglobus sp.]
MTSLINVKSSIHDYSIEIVDDSLKYIHQELGNGAFFIIDENIYRIYFKNSIFEKFPNNFLLIQPNEENKSIDKCKSVIEKLVEKKIRHNQKLVAIGGGITQDITAFIASIYLRGIEWTFFPTTLLAQADSCIGGKTSINLQNIKNIVGGFNPPVRIYLDFKFLETLLIDDIKSGIGEILHFYYYSNSPYIKKMMGEYDNLIENPKDLVQYIIESLTIKKSVIEIDEFDKDERNKFNYGHTFGHAIETATDYKIKHGQAVTVGMDIANYISYHNGIMDEVNYNEARKILEINFPKYNWLEFDNGLFLESLSKDKKNQGINLGCILSKGPGKLFKQFLPIDEKFKSLIKNYFEKIE